MSTPSHLSLDAEARMSMAIACNPDATGPARINALARLLELTGRALRDSVDEHPEETDRPPSKVAAAPHRPSSQ